MNPIFALTVIASLIQNSPGKSTLVIFTVSWFTFNFPASPFNYRLNISTLRVSNLVLFSHCSTWQWTTSKEHPGIAVLQSLTGMEASAQQNMLASASDPCFKITLNWRLTLCSQSNEVSGSPETF